MIPSYSYVKNFRNEGFYGFFFLLSKEKGTFRTGKEDRGTTEHRIDTGWSYRKVNVCRQRKGEGLGNVTYKKTGPYRNGSEEPTGENRTSMVENL